MPGKVIGIAMGNGWAGSQSRSADAIIQNRIADGDIKFGQAVKLTAENKWKAIGTDDTAASVAGIAFREVVQANTYNPQSNPDYMNGEPCDVLTRGNIIVKCNRGTPAAGSAVYVRITENSAYANTFVGGFEAQEDTGKTIQVPNIEWTTGVIDDNGFAEVTVKNRAKA